MSNKERWLSSSALLISILPFILVAGSLQLIPQTIPITLIGSETQLELDKYQYLYLGIIGLVPAALVVLARVLKARNLVERNFMYMVVAAFVLGVVFLFVMAYGMIASIVAHKVDLLMKFDFFGASAEIAALVVGMLANFLPVLRRNDMLGLKNRYTIRDNRVWIKVHYVAADVCMSTMFLFAIFSSALSIGLDYKYGWVHIALWVLVMSGLMVWSRVYSSMLYKKFNCEELQTA